MNTHFTLVTNFLQQLVKIYPGSSTRRIFVTELTEMKQNPFEYFKRYNVNTMKQQKHKH